MKVRVSEIKIQSRIRKEPGDLTGLKDSIKAVGLLNPILIDLQSNLIAGFRRLLAIKSLGWEYVEVKVIDIKSSKDRYMIEMEENKHRQDFTDADIERSTEFMENLSTKGNFFKDWIDFLFKRKK